MTRVPRDDGCGGLADRDPGVSVAAHYVLSGGPYFGLPHVDPWDVARDARHYDGPPPWSRIRHVNAGAAIGVVRQQLGHGWFWATMTVPSLPL